MFSSRTHALTTSLAATAAVLATMSGPSVAAPPPAVASDPAAHRADGPRTVQIRQVRGKPRGAAPSVAVVDPRSGVIGSGARRAEYDAELFANSVRAAGKGRYVLHSSNRLYVVRHGAAARLLAERAPRGYQVSGGRHERVVYYENAPSSTRLTVRRLRDGAVVDHLRVPRGVTPLAYRRGQVWFERGGRLLSWSPGTNRVQRRGGVAPYAIDLTAGAGVRFVGEDSMAYPLRPGAGWNPWQLPAGGQPLAWSPDGRRVAVGFTGNFDSYLRRVEIREARTGRLVRAFVTNADFQLSLPALRWETSSALLVPYQNPPNGTHVLLRLRASGSVERASGFGPSSFEPGPFPVWTPSGPSSDVFH